MHVTVPYKSAFAQQYAPALPSFIVQRCATAERPQCDHSPFFMGHVLACRAAYIRRWGGKPPQMRAVLAIKELSLHKLIH